MKKVSPEISIILAVYNCDQLLARAIESVIAQDFESWELIIANDGSTDRSEEVAKHYANKYPEKIKVFSFVHGGQSAAINSAFPHCQGKYVTTLDADDYYKNDHLKQNHEFLISHEGIDLLIGKVELIGERMIVDLEKTGAMIDVEDCMIGGTFFVKSKVFESVGGRPDVAYGTDYYFAKKVEKAGYNIYRSNIRKYVYDRTLGGSMTKIAEEKMLNEAR